MIVHVLQRVQRAQRVDRVLVATDDERIAMAVRSAGGEAVLTPANLQAGSDRVALVAASLDVDVVINVQGDEPLVDPETIDAVVEALDLPDADVSTAMAPLAAAEAQETARVKVVTDTRGHALYFSRAPIPHGGPWWVHLGMYAFRKPALLRFAALTPSALELSERLEQLRLLENGIPVRVVAVSRSSPSVDTPDDLARVRAILGEPGVPDL